MQRIDVLIRVDAHAGPDERNRVMGKIREALKDVPGLVSVEWVGIADTPKQAGGQA